MACSSRHRVWLACAGTSHTYAGHHLPPRSLHFIASLLHPPRFAALFLTPLLCCTSPVAPLLPYLQVPSPDPATALLCPFGWMFSPVPLLLCLAAMPAGRRCRDPPPRPRALQIAAVCLTPLPSTAPVRHHLTALQAVPAPPALPCLLQRNDAGRRVALRLHAPCAAAQVSCHAQRLGGL